MLIEGVKDATREFRRRIVLVCAVLSVIYVIGILGYELIEGWSFLDSTYMTVITLATIGFGETHPLTEAGRVFTILLILGGMSAVSWGFVTLTTLVAEGDFARALRKRRMEKLITKLSGHFIVCGAGKTGAHIIHELLNAGHQVVVVDRDPAILRRYESREALFAHAGRHFDHGKAFAIGGDASSDEVLDDAGIARAAGIFYALPDDKENLFVVLTARGLNPSLRIVSKCVNEESDDKFSRAGANAIVSSNRIGGLRMASEMIRPTVVSFLDEMLRHPEGYRFEELTVGAASPLARRPLGETALARHGDARVVALIGADGGCRYNPPDSATLEPGTRLILLAPSASVNALRREINPA